MLRFPSGKDVFCQIGRGIHEQYRLNNKGAKMKCLPKFIASVVSAFLIFFLNVANAENASNLSVDDPLLSAHHEESLAAAAAAGR